jgi:hypothetical protein
VRRIKGSIVPLPTRQPFVIPRSTLRTAPPESIALTQRTRQQQKGHRQQTKPEGKGNQKLRAVFHGSPENNGDQALPETPSFHNGNPDRAAHHPILPTMAGIGRKIYSKASAATLGPVFPCCAGYEKP